MVRPAVLIVDDEKGVQSSIQGILEDVGFHSQADLQRRRGDGDPGAQRFSGCAAGYLASGNGWTADAPAHQGAGFLLDYVVIMISGHGSIETAVRATKLGAFDFIEKPLSLEKTLAGGEQRPAPDNPWKTRTVCCGSRSSGNTS